MREWEAAVAERGLISTDPEAGSRLRNIAAAFDSVRREEKPDSTDHRRVLMSPDEICWGHCTACSHREVSGSRKRLVTPATHGATLEHARLRIAYGIRRDSLAEHRCYDLKSR